MCLLVCSELQQSRRMMCHTPPRSPLALAVTGLQVESPVDDNEVSG